MTRKLWPGYTSLYRSKAGDTVVVKSVTEPPKTRTLRGQGGLRKYRLIKSKHHIQEVLVVAKSTKTKAKSKKASEVEVTDDEIDELESVDELEDEDEDVEDDDEDEEEDDEPDDEDEDDEDDEEEEEPPKRSKKSKKPRKSRAAESGKVGTAEIAEAAGVDARTLRMVLRKHKVSKDAETGRYEWDSLSDPTVKKILKWIKAGEADDIKKESLDKLKDSQAKKKAAKEKSGKKKSKKKKVVEEDEDDDE